MANANAIAPLSPPALPLAPEQYDRKYQDQLNNVQRLFYNRLGASLNATFGDAGGQYIDCPNGLFFNTADQTFAATNTAYPVVYNQTYLSSNVRLKSGSTSQIETLVGGVYNFQYSGQLLSTNASAKNVFLWIKRNGTNIGYSTHAYTLAANGEYRQVNWNFNIDMQEGDYLELEAATTDTTVRLDAEAATTPHPGIPSSVMTVNFIAPLPATLPTPP
jgi:hypothetical protein